MHQAATPAMRKVWLLAATTTLTVTSFAMLGPVLAVLLHQRGLGTAAIGAFAMIGFSCVAVLIPIMPRLFMRWGLGRCFTIGAVLEAVSTVGYVFTDHFAVWCACAALGGAGGAAVWNATESLLAQHAPPAQRGRVMGLYQTALGAALAAGPLLPALLAWQAPTTLWAGAAIQFAALGVILLTGVARQLAPHPSASASATANSAVAEAGHVSAPNASGGTWAAVRSAPALVAIAFVGGAFEVGLNSISAANGAGMGLSLAQASGIVGMLGLGSFLFQYPAGMAADRYPARKVFAAAGAVLLVSTAAFTLGGQYLPVLWATALLWGGVGGALYTLCMVRVGHDFATSATATGAGVTGTAAAGTAAMISGYTLGGAVGPVVSGAALQYGGPLGLASWLGALAVGVILLGQRVR
jgi:MFS family permease